PVSLPPRIVGGPRVAGGGAVVRRTSQWGRFEHAAEDHRAGGLEALVERGLAVVPLADGERAVTGVAEDLAPEWVDRLAILRAVAVLSTLPEVTAREQRRAAGHADGSAQPPLDEGSVEHHAAVRQPVDVRRPHLRLRRGADGARRQVVREQDQ